jgi:hypothetical protein
MKIYELFDAQPITEATGGLQIFGRGKGGKSIKKKFRCTSGPRKGRVVSDPATCMKPIDIAKRIRAKRSRPKFKAKAAFARNRTMRSNPITKAIGTRNKLRKPKKSKFIKGL